MEKSHKNLRHSLSVAKTRLRGAQKKSALVGITSIAIATFFIGLSLPSEAKPGPSPAPAKSAKPSSKSVKPSAKPAVASEVSKVETYKDIILKAQNLTLQRDRLQTSQVLTRAIQREARGSVGFKELTRALDELTAVFYTEKAQTAFVTGEGLLETKPKDALEQFKEALRLEEGNVAILKAIARTHLVLGECARGEASVRVAEGLNPFAAEVKLLSLQSLECSKSFDLLTQKLNPADPDLETVAKYLFGLRLRDQLRQGDPKKARATLTEWEKQSPDYPEIFYWKWELGRQAGAADRAAALKYVQHCQNLTTRRRKSYILDVDLCKGKEAVETYLKETSLQPGVPPEDN